MKRYIPLATLALFLLTASDAVAQPGGGRGRGQRGGFGQAMLLQQASVQKELKLSDEQLQKVTELNEKQREAFAGLRDLEPEERREKLAEAQKSQREELAKILSAEQGQRLKQIDWQQAGPQALANPEVATALGLSDDQKKVVETAQTEMREQMRELFAAGPDGDREAARAKMTELQNAANEKLNKVLTAKQQTKFKELLGAPFTGEIVRPSFRGRRQGGPGARDNTNSVRQPFFQLTSFKEDDDGDDDKAKRDDDDDDDDDDKADKADKDDKKKDGKQGDDHKAREKKHRKHAEHKEHAAAKGKHRHGKPQHAGHRRHGRRGPHGQWARHPHGPNAEAWNRVAEAMGRRGPGAAHGRYAHHRWHHAGAHFRRPQPGPWAFQFQRRGEGERFARHGFPGHSHWSRGPMRGDHGQDFARPTRFTDHQGPRHHGHGPAQFAHHRGPHGPHHYASWRRHGGPHFQPGDARHDDDDDLRPRQRRRPPMPPAPPRAPDFRRSAADAPAGRLTRDGHPGDREEQLERLAQLERSLDRLAQQFEQLRHALRQ